MDMKNFASAGLVTTFATLGLSMTMVTPVAAESSIRVLVNDQAITSFDVAQRAKLMALAHEKGGPKDAMEQLIDEVIEIGDAKKHGLVVSDKRVDEAFARISQNMKMTPDALAKALESQGIVADTLKRRIRAQITWTQLVQAKQRATTKIKSSDITKELFTDSKADKRLQSTEFTLQTILFVVPKGSPAGYAAERQREAEAFRLRFAGCDKSIEQAKALKDVVVANVGRRTASDLTGADGKEVQNTAIGKATAPQKVDQGVELVAVCATRSIAGDQIARDDVENKLMAEQTKGVGDDYLKELRSKAIIQYR
jgi:peptidyl-prolyl cis-trans isomerase SurA